MNLPDQPGNGGDQPPDQCEGEDQPQQQASFDAVSSSGQHAMSQSLMSSLAQQQVHGTAHRLMESLQPSSATAPQVLRMPQGAFEAQNILSMISQLQNNGGGMPSVGMVPNARASLGENGFASAPPAALQALTQNPLNMLLFPHLQWNNMLMNLQQTKMQQQQQGLTTPQDVLERLSLSAAATMPGAAASTFSSQQPLPNLASTSATHAALSSSGSQAQASNNHNQNDLLSQPLALTNRSAMPLYLEQDEDNLTDYQILLRKQIELFEAGPDDIRGTAQGRNTKILLGQVGIRCRHCAPFPKAARPRGAVYYSQTIDGIYQVAQNMSKVHLCNRCNRVPPDVRQKLRSTRNENQRASGGKQYWADCIRSMGVYEDGRALRFRPRGADPTAAKDDAIGVSMSSNG